MLRHAATCCDMLRHAATLRLLFFFALKQIVDSFGLCNDALTPYGLLKNILCIPRLMGNCWCRVCWDRIVVIFRHLEFVWCTQSVKKAVWYMHILRYYTNYNLSPCECQKNTVNVFEAEVTRDRYMTWTMTFRQCHDISRSRRLMTVSLWKLLCLNLWQSSALIHGNPVLFRSSKWKISPNVGVLLDKHKEAAHHISWSPAAKPRPQSCQKVAVKVRAKLQKPCEGSSLQINQCIVAPGCAPRERCAAGQGAEVPTLRNIPRLQEELAMVRSE